jgi:ribosomal protein L35
MPKMKISKTVKDRLSVTGSGKIMRRRVGQRHKMIHKSQSNKRRGRLAQQVTGKLEKKIRKLLGV